MKYGIVIDRAVGAPGHGKDVVDGLNAADKKFLRTAMLRNSIPDEHNNVNTMICHSITPMGSFSLLQSTGAFYNTMQNMFLIYGCQSK
eukprot:11442402-Ditylum_brightwellii.AAC.1